MMGMHTVSVLVIHQTHKAPGTAVKAIMEKSARYVFSVMTGAKFCSLKLRKYVWYIIGLNASAVSQS